MTALRVLYVVDRFPERSQTFVTNELLEVARRGVEVDVVRLREPLDAAAAPPGIQVRTVPGADDLDRRALLRAMASVGTRWPTGLASALRLRGRDPGWDDHRAFRQAMALAAGLRRREVPDLLHAHFANTPTSVAMYVAAVVGRPFTFTGHANDLHVRAFDLPRKLRRAAATVHVCAYNQQQVEASHGAARSVAVVPCGVDVDAFTRSRPYDPAPPRVLAVGRLVPKKGFHDLVDACRLLRDRGVDLVCTIVGDGPLRPDLTARIVEHGLEDVVTLAGSQPHDRVREAMEDATLLCLPCVVAADGDRDAQPVVVKEAMAMGLPVVGTREVAMPEMVVDGTTGALVPPGEPGALAEALAGLLADPDRCRSMGRSGRALVEERFAFDVTIPRLLDVWRAAMG